MIARTTKDMATKEAVRKRDGYKCTECGMTQGEFRRQKNERRQARWRITCELHGFTNAEFTFSCLYKLHVHRIIPGGKGGEYSLENCRTLCPKCHVRQHPHPHRGRKRMGIRSPSGSAVKILRGLQKDREKQPA